MHCSSESPARTGLMGRNSLSRVWPWSGLLVTFHLLTPPKHQQKSSPATELISFSRAATCQRLLVCCLVSNNFIFCLWLSGNWTVVVLDFKPFIVVSAYMSRDSESKISNDSDSRFRSESQHKIAIFTSCRLIMLALRKMDHMQDSDQYCCMNVFLWPKTT
jgi:hypothetical protein